MNFVRKLISENNDQQSYSYIQLNYALKMCVLVTNWD